MEYKSPKEIKEILINQKNIIFEEGFDENFFLSHDYTRFFNPFKDFICTNKGSGGKRVYGIKTDFNYLTKLNECDEYISMWFVKTIGLFEKKIKSLLSCEICNSMVLNGDLNCTDFSIFQEMLEDNYVSKLSCFYPLLKTISFDGKETLDCTNFDYRCKAFEKIQALINENEGTVLNSFCLEYKEKHSGQLPFYILISSFSFSMLCALFNSLKIENRKRVYEKLFDKTESEISDVVKFSNSLSDLIAIRNITHHHEAVAPFVLRIVSKFDILMLLVKHLKLLNEKGRYGNIELIKPEIVFKNNGYLTKKIDKYKLLYNSL